MQYLIVFSNNKNKYVIRKRINCAIQEFNSTPAEYFNRYTGSIDIIKYIIISGPIDDENYNYLKKKIGERFIILETVSKCTIDNLTECKKLIETVLYPSTLYPQPDIVMCTSTFHIKRVIVLAKLIYGGYNIKFIHTNEQLKFTKNEIQYDNHILISDIDKVISTIFNYQR